MAVDMAVDGFELAQELKGHEASVRCLAVLKNGRIVTGGMDNLVCMWSTGGGEEPEAAAATAYKLEKTLTHHVDYIYCLCDAEGGENEHFYSSSREPIIYKLDYSGNPVLQFTGHEGAVNSLVDRGVQLFSGSWDGTCRIWDNSSGALVTKIAVGTHAIAVGLMPTGEIVTGDSTGEISFWKADGSEGMLFKCVTNINI